MQHAKSWALCLLLALTCLTSCGTLSSSRWKERAEGCRQKPEAEIADAPGTFPEYVPAYLDLLGIVWRWRVEDDAEWDCIADL